MNPDPYRSPASNLSTGVSRGRVDAMLGDLRPTAGSLFKIIFIGYFFGLGPLILLNGVYDLISGSESIISVNDSKLTGVGGFVGTLVFIPVFSSVMSGITWIYTVFGVWIYTRFRPLNLQWKE